MLVCLDALVKVVQALGQLAEYFPLCGRFLVLDCLLAVLGHFRAPDGVDAEVFVEDHEEIVEPAFTETFVAELGVVRVGGVMLDVCQYCLRCVDDKDSRLRCQT